MDGITTLRGCSH
jgi:hypothetical protein